ncbi:hypothetical protein SELMODRAFT_181715 [Selaginella moellendorffii]|uniref:soluble epoxide hydrolase n=1 Tax=Selaginella moellendorffii TaxID=88036 RepID=D8SQ23_SELML|nr:uncharacterized protein LOC9649892 [Selaginella moellendorffii]EFJ13514.1 hypothetical protein SELMODRAFT_181715 [Selaginella moellendorffii]|eukprot:XP_002985384.1 uncharacterized protein LOC9649892 [Selaginella moellendorffii]
MATDGEISHRFVETNGIKMHIAEAGSPGNPVVLLLHGFPELWYSWRHQMPALAAAGYRVVAPDLRGFGQTDAPHGMEKYTSLHIVGDLVGLLDALGEEKVFVAGHDWGAIIAWDVCLFRPDRVKALVALSVPYSPRNPKHSFSQSLKRVLGEGYYFSRFQEPGRPEADFARFDAKTVVKKMLLNSKGEVLVAPKDKEVMDILEEPTELPPWISEEELDYYAQEFSRTGFTTGLNYYRAANLSWELKAPWTMVKISVPALFVTGDRDLVYCTPGIRDYVDKGRLKADVPNLKETIVLSSGHFMQQESAGEVNSILVSFFGEII